jgi:transposase-like protein
MPRSAPGNGELTPVQQAAGLALAAGKSIEEAARETGVNPRTIKRWLHDIPALRVYVDALRADMVDRVLGQVTDGMLGATATLRVLSLRAQSETVRMRASVELLQYGLKLREFSDFDRRLSELEAQAPKPRRR